jgi:hypothetical protein
MNDLLLAARCHTVIRHLGRRKENSKRYYVKATAAAAAIIIIIIIIISAMVAQHDDTSCDCPTRNTVEVLNQTAGI